MRRPPRLLFAETQPPGRESFKDIHVQEAEHAPFVEFVPEVRASAGPTLDHLMASIDLRRIWPDSRRHTRQRLMALGCLPRALS